MAKTKVNGKKIEKITSCKPIVRIQCKDAYINNQGTEMNEAERLANILETDEYPSDRALEKAAVELRRLSAINAELVDACDAVSRRLTADIDDGSRPDQWSMEAMVNVLLSASNRAKQ